MSEKEIYNKPYRTPEEIVDCLIEEGLNCGVREECIEGISVFGYENFKPYIDSIRNDDGFFPKNKSISESNMRYVRDIYYREIIFTRTTQLELYFKACLTDVLGKKYGAHPYNNVEIYQSKNKKNKFFRIFKKKIEESKKDIILKYRNTYKSPTFPPIWDLVHATTFGLVFLWFTLLNSAIQSEISNIMGVKKLSVFRTWLHTMVELRNETAHHGVIFNIKIKNTPKNIAYPSNDGKKVELFPAEMNVSYDYFKENEEKLDESNDKLKHALLVLDFLLEKRTSHFVERPILKPSITMIETLFQEIVKTYRYDLETVQKERNLSGF